MIKMQFRAKTQSDLQNGEEGCGTPQEGIKGTLQMLQNETQPTDTSTWPIATLHTNYFRLRANIVCVCDRPHMQSIEIFRVLLHVAHWEGAEPRGYRALQWCGGV